MQIRYYLILILLIFSLLLNLGIYPLYLEEPRRAVVALEMVLTGNYIVPTIMTEPYFAKPPLFNWIIIASAKLYGSFSEFAIRLPTVISLILLGLIHYFVVSKYLGWKIAFFSSLSFITSGTILFYFSLLGEIDIFYSLITYLSIISVFWFFHRDIRLMFLFSFLFASFGFLTKGFPSVLFLYVTLISYLFFENRLRLLFSIWHFVSLLIFVFIVGFYLYLYDMQIPVEEYVKFLWKESSQRTVVENPVENFLLHILEFPLKTVVAILPWSFLVIFILRKDLFSVLFKNKFLKFLAIAFLFNYLIYWISPGANQRYIYMLFPFLLTIFVYFYFNKKHSVLKEKILRFIFFLIIAVFSVLSFSLPFFKLPVKPEYIYYISVVFGFLFLILAFRVFKKPLYYAAIGLMWFRIFFDIVYLPVKAVSGTSYLEKKYGITVADLTLNSDLFYYGRDKVNYGLLFYIERERNEPLVRNLDLDLDAYYLARTRSVNFKVVQILRFKTKHEYILFKKVTDPSSYDSIKSSIPQIKSSR